VLTVPIQSVTTRTQREEKREEQTGEGEAKLIKKDQKKRDEEKVDEVVFVVKDGVAKTKTVKRGISDDAYVEISEGLEKDLEVVSGPFKAINRDLEDGSKVKVDNEKPGRKGKGTQSK
jgi:HlyD family secretion protein